MGFLNFLTESNPILVKLISIPFCIVITILSLKFVLYIFGKDSSKTQEIILYFLECSVISILEILFPNIYSNFISTFTLPLLFAVIFKIRILEIFLLENIFIFIKGFLNLILYVMWNQFIENINWIEFSNIPICNIIVFLVESVFWLSANIIIRKYNFKLKNLTNINSKKFKKTFIELLTGYIILVLVLIECILISNKNNLLTILISSIILIYFFINRILNILKIVELEDSYHKIENLETYNKTLNVLYDELSAFKHDFNNIIQTIGGLLMIEKYDYLKQYYKKLQDDCQTINDIEILNPDIINNPGIFTLLVNKYKLAKQNGIRMNLEIYSDLSKLDTNIFEIIRILGILLDNAIEATCECSDKYLNVEFRYEKNIQHIIIENSYLDKNISTETIFEKGFSTKTGNTGLGLWKVKKILKQHNNLSLHTFKNADFFTQELEIYI